MINIVRLCLTAIFILGHQHDYAADSLCYHGVSRFRRYGTTSL